MKKLYMKPLLAYFETWLKDFDAEYERLQVDSSHPLSRAAVYVKRLTQNDWLFICLRPSPKGYAEYDYEIGWSSNGRIPKTLSRSADLFGFAAPPEEEKNLYIGIPPVGGNWELERTDRWLPHDSGRITPEAAKRIVEPIAEQSIQHLLAVGIPILIQVEQYVRSRSGKADGRAG